METKSTENYVASSARKLNIELTSDTEVQKSQAFTTLRDELSARLEEIRVKILTNFIAKAAELTLSAKLTRFQVALCIYIRRQARMFIAQYDTQNYHEDLAVMEVITYKHDSLLVTFKMSLKEFLILYKDTHKLDVIPYPTIDEFTNDLRSLWDLVNNKQASPACMMVTTITAVNNPYATSPSTSAFTTTQESVNSDNHMNEDDGDNDPYNVMTGGKHHIARLTWSGLVASVLEPHNDYHDQRIINAETKRIKNMLTTPRLTDAAIRINAVLGNEPPVPQPVLWGLIGEVSTNNTKLLESRLKSFEDQLAASKYTIKAAKKVRGDGMMKKGTPTAVKRDAPKSIPKSIPNSTKSSNLKPKSILKGRGANNNDSASGNNKLKRGGQKVSFENKKSNSRTNSRK